MSDSAPGSVAKDQARRSAVVVKLMPPEVARLDYCCKQLCMTRANFVRLLSDQVSRGGFRAGELVVEFPPFDDQTEEGSS